MDTQIYREHRLWSVLSEASTALQMVRSSDGESNLAIVEAISQSLIVLEKARADPEAYARVTTPDQLDRAVDSLELAHLHLFEADAQNPETRAGALYSGLTDLDEAREALGALAVIAGNPRFQSAFQDLAEIWNQEVETRLAELRGESADIQLKLDSRLDQYEMIRARSDEATALAQAASARAQDSVDRGQERINKLIDETAKSAAELSSTRTEVLASFDLALREALDEQRHRQEAGIAELRERYRVINEQAERELETLKRNVSDHQAIIQSDSGTRLAHHYDEESKSARTSGWWLVGAGFAALIGAMVPLLIIVISGANSAEMTWSALAARLGITVVLGGAATVAIRMGSGFHRRSDEYKRLSMELRTMDPFLSGVANRESVDKSRLDLVSRTFGHAYRPPASAKEAEAVPVSLLENVIALVMKAAGRS